MSILLFSSISTATNFYERHGNNFIYLDSSGAGQFDTLTYAPIIWDLRSASYDLTNYYISYGWETVEDRDSTLNAITLLMQEAFAHGVNTANVRGEISRGYGVTNDVTLQRRNWINGANSQRVQGTNT